MSISKHVAFSSRSKSFHLSVTSSSLNHVCNSCRINKSQQLPFGINNIKSTRPIEYIYSNVRGPTHTSFYKGFKCYAIFNDHYTRYYWLFPMILKYDITTIFPQLHVLLEKKFEFKITHLYSDNGGEYTSLKPYLDKYGISHLTTHSYTSQHNGISEHQHR